MIDFGKQWDKYLSLAKFAYNDRYHSSIDMVPFEALYGSHCHFLVSWINVFEVRP